MDKKYTDKLRLQVIKCYPTNTQIHKLLEANSSWLGRYLDDNRQEIDYNFLLNAKSLKEVKERAQEEKEKDLVYKAWKKEYYP